MDPVWRLEVLPLIFVKTMMLLYTPFWTTEKFLSLGKSLLFELARHSQANFMVRIDP